MTDSPAPENLRLTPTQDLVMEVLAARWREGWALWTFDARHRRTLASLAALGLIHEKDGVVERTRLAWLTDRGRQAWRLDRPYSPPRAGETWVRADLRKPARFTVEDPRG